jgi:DNA-nicking Smr family endonuclease
MATDRFAKHVLAFATARQHDGGAGAVYVLLRKV